MKLNCARAPLARPYSAFTPGEGFPVRPDSILLAALFTIQLAT
ncbi:hypothetical protein ACVWYO_001480 [Sphingomonas sp. UYP23]